MARQATQRPGAARASSLTVPPRHTTRRNDPVTPISTPRRHGSPQMGHHLGRQATGDLIIGPSREGCRGCRLDVS